MIVQEHHLLAAFVQRVRRGLTLRRLLQSGIVLLTICLTVLLLGVGVQYIVPLVPLVATLYSSTRKPSNGLTPTVWPLTWCRRCTIVRRGRCNSTACPMSCVEAGCWVSRGAPWWDW